MSHNLIEQCEAILNEEVKIFEHPFMVAVHQANDEWFIADFSIPTVEYKNWFNHLRGKGREWQFTITVPYLIRDLVEARKIDRDAEIIPDLQKGTKLCDILLGGVYNFIYTMPRRRLKKSQLRKWGKVYQDTHKQLAKLFCCCGSDKKDKGDYFSRANRCERLKLKGK